MKAPGQCPAIGMLLTVLTILGTLRSTLATTATPIPCSGCQLLGSFYISAPTLEPASPAVGELVTLSFPVLYYLAFSFSCQDDLSTNSCWLLGGEAYLEGSDPPHFDYATQTVSVRRRVVQTGLVQVSLAVTALTEDRCDTPTPDGGCGMFFQYAYLHASSPPFEVILGNPGTPHSDDPTPTLSPSPPPTPTPCPPCYRYGYLSIGVPTLDPPFARVGDEVNLLFSVDYMLPYGLCNAANGSCSLSGGHLYLEGDSPAMFDYALNAVVVRRRVVRAGTALVQLDIRALTEDFCFSPAEFGCNPYYTYDFIEASSGPSAVQFHEAGEPGPTPPTATPTTTASATPTLGVNDPPEVIDAPAQTTACRATITGLLLPSLCARGGLIYADKLEGVPVTYQCSEGTFWMTVPLRPNRVNHFDVCQEDDDLGDSRGCTPVEIAQRFVGDCGDDGEVTVDDLATMIAVALGDASSAACRFGDGDADGGITIDEVVTAIGNALNGCR